MQTSGFTNAPASQILLIALVVTSVLATLTDTKYYFWIAIKPHLTDYAQYWRLLIWQLCYTNSTEVLFAGMTLYQLRTIERLWGTRKFISFLLTTLPYTTLLPPLLLILVIRPLSFGRVNYLPAGPTAPIFALLAQYYAMVPYLYKYQLSASPSQSESSLMLTSKATSYLLPAQLALSQFPGSMIAAAMGWIVGVAWRREVLPGTRWRVPALDGRGKEGERERFEGLRRRMEGEAVASGSDTGGAGSGRGWLGDVVGRFRGRGRE